MKSELRESIDKSVEPRLVCIDFHGTMVFGNWDEKLKAFYEEGIKGLKAYKIEDIKSPSEAMQNIIDKLLQNPVTSLKHCNELKATISALIEGGHYVCVTSFSIYPQTIKIALKALNLKPEHLKQISVICGRPIDRDLEVEGKTWHIEAAMKWFKIENDQNVTLFDDDRRMIQIAEGSGHHAVLAPKCTETISHFEQILYPSLNSVPSKHCVEVALRPKVSILTILQEKIEAKIQAKKMKKPESNVDDPENLNTKTSKNEEEKFKTKSLPADNLSFSLEKFHSESLETIIIDPNPLIGASNDEI